MAATRHAVSRPSRASRRNGGLGRIRKRSVLRGELFRTRRNLPKRVGGGRARAYRIVSSPNFLKILKNFCAERIRAKVSGRDPEGGLKGVFSKKILKKFFNVPRDVKFLKIFKNFGHGRRLSRWREFFQNRNISQIWKSIYSKTGGTLWARKRKK